MYRAPSFLRQRHHGGALHTGKYIDNLLQLLLGGIHQDIFLVFGHLHGIHAEKQFVQDFLLFGRHVLVANEQCFRLHHYLDLFQAVAHQGRTRANDVEDSIGQSDTRRNLYRTGNDVYLGTYALLFQEARKDAGIGSGNGFAFEPLQTGILDILGHGQRQTATAEAQSAYDFGIFVLFGILVFAHNTDVGNAGGYGLRDVVVAQEEHFDGEIRRLYQKCALGGTQLDIRFC